MGEDNPKARFGGSFRLCWFPCSVFCGVCLAWRLFCWQGFVLKNTSVAYKRLHKNAFFQEKCSLGTHYVVGVNVCATWACYLIMCHQSVHRHGALLFGVSGYGLACLSAGFGSLRCEHAIFKVSMASGMGMASSSSPIAVLARWLFKPCTGM